VPVPPNAETVMNLSLPQTLVVPQLPEQTVLLGLNCVAP
jgi:hypothetical protein